MHSLLPDYLARLRFDARQLATLRDMPAVTGRLSIDPLTNSPQNRSAVVQEIRAGKVVFSTKIAAE